VSDRPILFVGDIQGCADELRALLEAAGFRAARHRLVPVGDTINRGPDAPEVLRLLRDAGAEPILGNHERHLLSVVAGKAKGDWQREGSALAQLGAAGDLDRAAEWISTWPLLRRGRNWIVVHAGLHPRRTPEDTGADFLTEVRFCNAQGNRPKLADGKLTEPPRGFKPWYEFYSGPRTVMFGHWARLGLLVRERLRGLDTGCVYGGQLTGLWWPEDRLVQVPSQQPYRRLPEAKKPQ